MSCYLYFFCLHCCLINTHIFDYPDSRLSGLFTEVPTSPDNRGSTVPRNNDCFFSLSNSKWKGKSLLGQKQDYTFHIISRLSWHHPFLKVR